jgi:hypothetical protein
LPTLTLVEEPIDGRAIDMRKEEKGRREDGRSGKRREA